MSFAVCLFLSSGAVIAAEIGQVIRVVPGAFVTREGKTIPLAVHSPVEVTDTLTTDATGRARILFNDDSTVAVGSNTSLDLRDYADSGSKPVFDVHLMQGVARVVTGRVVEMNPSGFKVTTPEAHVGIRGTIISMRSMNGVTTVYVENTTREVYVNDIRVPGGQKITLPDDPLRTEPIQPEDRRELGRDLAFLGGRGVAAAAPEPEMVVRIPTDPPLAYVNADSGTASPDTPLKTLPLSPLLPGGSLGPSPAPLGSTYVSGLLASGGSNTPVYSADFAFNVNLGTGAVTSAEMHGLVVTPLSVYEQFDVVGGSGTMTAGTTVISGFTGHAISYAPGSVAYVPPIVSTDATTLTFTSPTPGVLGSSVSGGYDINSSGWGGIDTGTLSGTWGVMPPMLTTGSVSGNLYTSYGLNTFSGTFTFDVNLTSGNISNATLNGSGLGTDSASSITAPLAVDFIGGVGTVMSPGGFIVDNFSQGGGANTFNGVALDGTTYATTWIKGNPNVDLNIVHSGGLVPVDYGIDYVGGSYDVGFGAGTITKP
ncbi:MAG: FecR family protein [Candidatus Accumulibacter sp.]|nr:FecR family protein [Accumulibacter sp.]